jgi:hypothetical protein
MEFSLGFCRFLDLGRSVRLQGNRNMTRQLAALGDLPHQGTTAALNRAVRIAIV